MKKLFFLISFFLSPLTFSSFHHEDAGLSRENHILLGNPDGAKNNIKNSNNYLILRDQYALSYNKSKLIANWVSWHVGTGDIGKAKRTNSFRPDMTLPKGWYKVRPNDYNGSGFDKGHLCPSADRTNSEKDNDATFLMTNMVPQAPGSNRGVWREFEEYCRRLVKRGNELYIIAGAYGEGGTGSKGKLFKLRHQVTVPSNTWKAIIILPEGDNDLGRINIDTRIICIDIPNKESVKNKKWRDFKITLAELELHTGFSLFNNINPDAKRALLTKMDKR